MKLLGVALMATALVVAGCRFFMSSAPDVAKGSVEWTLLDVNQGPQQADAHLLRFESGLPFLVDAGAASDESLKALRRRKISALDTVVISHAHKDHYGGLRDILLGGIRVRRVIFRLPDRAICDREKPWGCDYDDVVKVRDLARAKGATLEDGAVGQVLLEQPGVRLEILVAHDGMSPPVGKTDINDTSLILKLTAGKIAALFTGDLNEILGAHLAKQGDPRLSAQLLKVPHHGTDSLAPDAFFDKVAPQAAFVPAPAALWASDRSARARRYFETRKIPTYVSGARGEITVSVGPENYQVRTSR